MNTAEKTSHIYGLDVFRSWAILFVLIGHTLQVSTIPTLVSDLGAIGILGVELFFVLSGFLIGPMILKIFEAPQKNLSNQFIKFWKRRWLRTLPLYYVILLAFQCLNNEGGMPLSSHFDYFIFKQNFIKPIPLFFGLSWSLSIEEHFYIWFPIILLIWSKIFRNINWAVIVTTVTIIAIVYKYRISLPLFDNFHDYDLSVRMPVISRMDSIMFGVLIALIKDQWPKGFSFIKKCTPITAALFVFVWTWWCAMKNPTQLLNSRLLQLHLWTVQSILIACLLPWFDGLTIPGPFQHFFRLTSRISYSLYLVHILVLVIVERLLHVLGLFERIYPNPFLLYPLLFTLYFLVAWISYNLVEAPFIKLRDLSWTWKNWLSSAWISILLCLVFITMK